jgi:hypothetical protein
MQHRRFLLFLLAQGLLLALFAVDLLQPPTARADAPETQGEPAAPQGGPVVGVSPAAPAGVDPAVLQWRDVEPLPLGTAPGAAALPDPQVFSGAAGPAQQTGDAGLSWLTRQVNVGNWVVDAVLGSSTAQLHALNEALLAGVGGIGDRIMAQTGCSALVFCVSSALFFEGPLGAQLARLWSAFQPAAIGMIAVFFVVRLNQAQLEGGRNRIAAAKDILTGVILALIITLAGQWPASLLIDFFRALSETMLSAGASLTVADLVAFNLRTAGFFNLGASLAAFLLSLAWAALFGLVLVRWFRIAVLLLLLPLVGPCLLLPSTRRYATFWIDSLVGLLLQHIAQVAAFTLGSVLVLSGSDSGEGPGAALIWAFSALLGVGFAFCGTSLFNGLLGGAGTSSTRSAGSWMRSTAGQALAVAAGQRAGMTTSTLGGSLASGALLGGLSGGVRGALLGGAASGLTHRRRAITAAEGTLEQTYSGHATRLQRGDRVTAERQRRLTPAAQEQLTLSDLGREGQRRTAIAQLGRAVARGTLTPQAAQQQVLTLATGIETARALEIHQLAAADGTLHARTPEEQIAHRRQQQQLADRLSQRQRQAQRQQPTPPAPALTGPRAAQRAAILQRWERNDHAAAAADAAAVIASGHDGAVLAQMEQRADARAVTRTERIARLDRAYTQAGPGDRLQQLDATVRVTQRTAQIGQQRAVRQQRDGLLTYQRSAEDAVTPRRAPAGLSAAQRQIVVRMEQRWHVADQAAAQRDAVTVVTDHTSPAAVAQARQAADTRAARRIQLRQRLHAAVTQPGPQAGLARLNALERQIRAGEEVQ